MMNINLLKQQDIDISQRLLVICGPTAVGKTDLAIKLCEEFGGEMVSADSQQVYRGMDIGTAKDDLTGSGIPCHVVDAVNPDEPFDASKYQKLADCAIRDISSRGKLPVVVGGTGFYIKVLLEGICEAPERDENIRAELAGISKKSGAHALYEILRGEDAEVASHLHPNDVSRIIRAIEVKRLTGKSLAELHAEHQKTAPRRYQSLKIGLNIDRGILYERINARVDRMMEGGLLGEVGVIVRKYGYDIQSLNAVGYKEIVACLKGEIDIEEAVRETKRNTRRFAKRQFTWFKADRQIIWHSPDECSNISKAVSKFIS